MPYNDSTDFDGRDSLTTVIVSLLALAALGGTAFCLGYAIWWLIKVWAPF